MADYGLDLGSFDLGYNDAGAVAADGESSSGIDYGKFLSVAGQAVDLYGKIRTVSNNSGGSVIQTPVTIPAPNSPIGRSDLVPPAGPDYFDRVATMWGTSKTIVYAAAAVAGLGALWLVSRFFKR